MLWRNKDVYVKPRRQ